jgi:hypothetical protein
MRPRRLYRLCGLAGNFPIKLSKESHDFNRPAISGWASRWNEGKMTKLPSSYSVGDEYLVAY